jgi:GATA-binding protein, other eukaryote
MKKTVIKRRKRVVPALRDQSPTAATKSSSGSSASPEASPGGPASNSDEQHQFPGSEHLTDLRALSSRCLSPQAAAQRPFALAPPPVDFTDYSSHSISLPHHPPPPPRLLEPDSMNPSNQAANTPFSRQSSSPRASPLATVSGHRTIADPTPTDPSSVSATLEPGSNQLPPIMSPSNLAPPVRLSPISSLLNHASAPENSRPDSSTTPHSLQPPQPYPSLTQIPTDIRSYKAGRRAQLQREAEEMREALWAKERELAELDQS